MDVQQQENKSLAVLVALLVRLRDSKHSHLPSSLLVDGGEACHGHLL